MPLGEADARATHVDGGFRVTERVERGLKQRVCLRFLVTIRPETTERRGGAQLERLRTLRACRLER